MSILKRSSKSSCDLSESEPDTMKDLQSFTGFATAYKNMTASPDGTQLLFK
ncbi:unnamed protein product [Anisakis simplex]|uniref:Uncharacterized protein n=1 Tax=Anisakis simplex TaxID=6269 RepID=A0A3P6PQC0_ANISI|nr:unnamed protein product [Anisakis simplex]